MEIPEKSRVWRREENIGKLGKKWRKQKLHWILMVRGVSISFFSVFFPPFLHCLPFASYVSSEDRISRLGCREWVEIRARGHNRLWRTRRPPMEECGDESTRHSWRWEHETRLEEKTLGYGGEEKGWEGERTGRKWEKRGNKRENGLRGGDNR